MGTRSLTYVYETSDFADDKNNLKPITCIYRQFDGYPTGIGADIKAVLCNARVVNGLPCGSKEKLFNGMGDLAAMLIYELKQGDTGNVYIQVPVLNEDAWQEYEYHITEIEGTIFLKVKDPIETLWSGPIDDFDPKAVEELP